MPKKPSASKISVQLYCEGLSVGEICQRLQIAHAVVYRALRKAGVSLRPQPTVPPEVVKQAIDLYQSQSCTVKEVCQRIGLSAGVLYARLDAAGTPRDKKQRLSASVRDARLQNIDEIIQRYQDRESAASIAKSMGKSHQGILDLLRRHGVKIRPTGAQKGKHAKAHKGSGSGDREGG